MSDLYSPPSAYFVDSIVGTASAGNVKNLVPIAVNRRYHKKVQQKLALNLPMFIGPDTFTEGDLSQTATGYPIIRKTDLSNAPGDSIRIGAINPLAVTVNSGVVGGAQLVNSELGFDFDDTVVKINQQRQGVLTKLGINQQRSPYDLVQVETELLSDFQAKFEELSIWKTLHYGWAPHILREHGTTNCPVTATNTLIGNDLTLGATAKTVAANLDASGVDNLSAQTFDIINAYWGANYFDKVVVDGDAYILCFISDLGALHLINEEKFRQAMLYAMQRGADNPLFKRVRFIYGNCAIMISSHVSTDLVAYDPTGLTTAGPPGAITEASHTLPGGLATTDIHQTYAIGANAILLAEGQLRMGDRIRAENDYNNLLGRAVDNVWGARRASFTNPAATTTVNQSSLRVVNTVGVHA